MATQASIDLAQQMYVAYYGRPADPGGLAYWADVFDSTSDLTDALSAFGNASEFTDNFGSLSSSDLITNLYQQMYGHTPDSGGLAFYLDRLDTGAATLASIAKQIADGSQLADLETLNNRIEVANTFTTRVETTGATYATENIADAQALLAAVDETEASTTDGKSSATTFVNELPDADSNAADDPTPIAGTWYLQEDAGNEGTHNITMTIGADGSFSIEESLTNPGSTETNGVESGTFIWNASTGAFDFTITSDANGTFGLSDGVSNVVVTVSDSTLSVTGSDGLSWSLSDTDPNSGDGTGSGEPSNNQSIVGTWDLAAEGEDSAVMVTFLSDGTFVLINDYAEDGADDAQDGYELGTYSYNQSTGDLSINYSANTDGTAGFSDSGITSATVGETSVTFHSSTEGDIPFTKLAAEGTGSLVGSWKVDSSDVIILNFTSDGRYMMVQTSVADEDGQPGIEHGTYSYNSGTGVLTSSQIVDTNGQWGISDPTDGVPYEVSVTGSNWTADESGSIFTAVLVDVWMA